LRARGPKMVISISDITIKGDFLKINNFLTCPHHAAYAPWDWGETLRNFEKSIEAIIWRLFVTQGLFSSDLLRFWSLGDPGVRLACSCLC